MIEIVSYLRNLDGGLTPIDEASDPPPDPRHIEGALELTIDGVPVIDKSLWDYIDILWAYISNMVEGYTTQGEASTYFPDQPIHLSLRRQGKSHVLVTLNIPGMPEREIRGVTIPASTEQKRVALAAESELISSLREGGTKFFLKIRELLPHGHDYVDALTRLNNGWPPAG
jgi:hypothetical protein